MDLLSENTMLSNAMDVMDNRDDIFLSQALEDIENSELLNSELSNTHDDLFLSQALEDIENSGLLNSELSNTQMASLVNECKTEDFGNFNLELNDRFGKPVSENDMDHMIEEQKSKNTKRNTNWAFGVYNTWRNSRLLQGEHIPPLREADVNIHLSRFITETRKQNGEYYPPRSVYSLACGLLRKLRDDGIYDRNFLDEADARYARFRSVLDAQMKKLTRLGLDAAPKQAQPLSAENEEQLWKNSVFGDSNATSLQYTVYFYNCKLFGLRGYDEHRELETNQFEISVDENGIYIQYSGKNSKTYNGGLKHRKLDPKVIKHYDVNNTIAPYYKKYLSAVGQGPFYMRPLSVIGTGGPRYGNQVVGVNKIKSFMKDMCKLGGLVGNFSNHSGKRTCATVLYQQGIPEEEIMKRTGHRSVQSVRKYQTPSASMLVDISNKLNPPVSDVKSSGIGLDMSATCKENDLKSVTDCIDGDKPLTKLESRCTSSVSDVFKSQSTFHNCVFKF